MRLTKARKVKKPILRVRSAPKPTRISHGTSTRRPKKQRKNVTSKGWSSAATSRITTFIAVEQNPAATTKRDARAVGGSAGRGREGPGIGAAVVLGSKTRANPPAAPVQCRL